MDSSSVKRRLTCILAADAVGYSKQMAQDEEGTIRVLSAHRAVIDGIITFHNGRIVSTAGDSVLAEFSSAVEAVRCAVEIQEALKTRNDSLPEHRQMHFRVGVNLGDVVVKGEDLLGDGVNVAARLEATAEPGGICISSSVYDQITGKLDLGFQDIGEQTLKNISRPIRVYRVSGAGSPVPPPRPVAPVVPAPSKRNRAPWAVVAIVAIVVAGAIAWQGLQRQSGSTDSARTPPTSAPNVAASSAPAPEKSAPAGPIGDATVTRAREDSDVQRLRSDAEALKRQAEAELARVRADAEASKTNRAKVEATASLARQRAQADADAAKIRAEAEAAAARTKSEAEAASRAVVTAARLKSDTEAAARAAEVEAAKASEAQRESAAKSRETAARAPTQLAADTSSRTAQGDRRFDGRWNITVECPNVQGASGYTLELTAQVKDGFLRGERGTEGEPASIRLQGTIQSDGSAKLDAKGFTGDPKYNANRVQQGVPYAYTVEARFEGTRGTGRRVQLRPCDLTFFKQ